MATCISRSPEDTAALGEAWGRAATAGCIIGLSGALGAGKTQLVKGLARGLGVGDRVHSPTFTLVNLYGGGRLPLIHLDLYRLETAAQIVAAGLEEFLRDPAGVVVIEWAERWFGCGVYAKPRSPDLQPFVAGATKGCEGLPGTPGAGAPLERRVACGPDPLWVPARWRRVEIETLSETERCIRYEDLGA